MASSLSDLPTEFLAGGGDVADFAHAFLLGRLFQLLSGRRRRLDVVVPARLAYRADLIAMVSGYAATRLENDGDRVRMAFTRAAKADAAHL